MLLELFYLIQFSSVAQSCPTLYDSMDCSTPGFPVHHQFPELAQTHVHRAGDAIQPSHPLSSPFPLAFNLSQLFSQIISKEFFSSGDQSIGFSFTIGTSSEHSGLISFRIELVVSPFSPKDSQKSSPTSQFKSINSLVLSFLYSPTLIPIHDHWKNHSFD